MQQVKEFRDFEFECDFFLNVHYICQENTDLFWSDAQKKDISNWLRKAKIITNVFNSTWDSKQKLNQPLNETKLRITDLSGLIPQNIEERYAKLFNRWKFRNSDKKIIDGKEITEGEKTLIQMSFFNIIPEPKQITIEEIKDGFPLEEIDFIEQEIKANQPKHEKTIGSKVNLTVNKQLKLYLDYLANRKNDLLNKGTPEQTNLKLKVPQIALIHAYNGIQITRSNASEIARNYGYTNKSSGEGLFQDYTFYCNPANRKATPTLCTSKKLKNKILLLESITEHLIETVKQRALDEIKILKNVFENEYQ